MYQLNSLSQIRDKNIYHSIIFIVGVTEIYIPELTFGKVPEFKITPNLPSEWVKDSFDRLMLRITNSGDVRGNTYIYFKKGIQFLYTAVPL